MQVYFIYLSLYLQEFLAKHKCNSCLDSMGKIEKNVRFREASFEFGEQIAVLGIVKQVTDDSGDIRKVLCPVRLLPLPSFLSLFIHYYIYNSVSRAGEQRGVYGGVLREQRLVGLGPALLAGPHPAPLHHPHRHAQLLPGTHSSIPHYHIPLSMYMSNLLSSQLSHRTYRWRCCLPR